MRLDTLHKLVVKGMAQGRCTYGLEPVLLAALDAHDVAKSFPKRSAQRRAWEVESRRLFRQGGAA